MDPTLLDRTASVGGFFALRAGGPEPGHRPLADVYAGRSPLLGDRVDAVAAALRAPERRVAASVAHLGLAARLWSVALGCAALHGRVPDLDPALLHWDPARSAPDDLVLREVHGLPADAATVRETVLLRHLVPLAEALRRDTRVSARLLWGNAGSALAGAVRELTAWSRRAGRPEAAERAASLAGELFAGPGLSGTVHGPALRRRTCCLYYRCPSGGLCGDCVFDRPPGRRQG